MPTSRSKNLLYRAALPFAPRVSGTPLIRSEGHAMVHPKELSRVIRRHHISGGALYFASGTEDVSLFTRAFHTALEPSDTTFFRVASVTKMATALLAYRLQDLGLLDLSAPLASCLEEAGSVPELKDVSCLHLLSHTSGLADPANLESLLNRHEPYAAAVADRRVSQPGEAFRYANLGYGLLGCVFETVLGRPLGQIYEEYLFSPLGLNATIEGCTLPVNRIMPVVRILPYRPENALTVTPLGKTPLTEPDPLHHYGHSAGSMYIDLPSLARLLCCIRDGGKPLMSSPSLMREKMVSYGSISPTLSYGFGLLQICDPRISSGPVYGHQGFAYGCVDGAFWEESTGRLMISLNGGCSEARDGRLGLVNFDLCRFAFRKELPSWN